MFSKFGEGHSEWFLNIVHSHCLHTNRSGSLSANHSLLSIALGNHHDSNYRTPSQLKEIENIAIHPRWSLWNVDSIVLSSSGTVLPGNKELFVSWFCGALFQIPGVPIMYITQHQYSIERLPEATIGGGNDLLHNLRNNHVLLSIQGSFLFCCRTVWSCWWCFNFNSTSSI